MTKVVYLGAEEKAEVEDGDKTVTVAQGEAAEVSDATLAQLKLERPGEFWFGDEPEPEYRMPGAEDVQPSDGARKELTPEEPTPA